MIWGRHSHKFPAPESAGIATWANDVGCRWREDRLVLADRNTSRRPVEGELAIPDPEHIVIIYGGIEVHRNRAMYLTAADYMRPLDGKPDDGLP